MTLSSFEQDFSFFADEAGISNDRFTVVGGISLRSERILEVRKNIASYRQKHRMNSELKWSKISNQKIDEYIAFARLFFAMNSVNQMQFHAICFDSHMWNHAKFNDGDGDVGLSKLYFQLILHRFVRKCGNAGSLFACLDHRTSSTPLDDLKKMINSVAARDYQMDHKPLKQLISRDSKKDDLLQINDVILGAVCAARNGKHLLETTRKAKKELAEFVLQQCGLSTFESDSPRNINRFTIWNFNPQPRK